MLSILLTQYCLVGSKGKVERCKVINKGQLVCNTHSYLLPLKSLLSTLWNRLSQHFPSMSLSDATRGTRCTVSLNWIFFACRSRAHNVIGRFLFAGAVLTSDLRSAFWLLKGSFFPDVRLSLRIMPKKPTNIAAHIAPHKTLFVLSLRRSRTTLAIL